jgi:SpoVK/Ycf46/Vps4 family AAA+-type ATPase
MGDIRSERTKRAEASRDKTDLLAELVVSIVQVGIACYGSYVVSNWIRNKGLQQGQRAPNEEARERLTKMLMEREMEDSDDEDDVKEKVRRKIVVALDLNHYETAIAEDVVDPADITTTFHDVGGIDHIKTELWDLVVLPILRPDLFRSQSGLVAHPKGILLCTST